MAKIYLSYNSQDSDFIHSLANALKTLGHEALLDVDTLMPSQDWRRTLMESLKTSEVFVVAISENSLRSHYVLSEIGAARIRS